MGLDLWNSFESSDGTCQSLPLKGKKISKIKIREIPLNFHFSWSHAFKFFSSRPKRKAFSYIEREIENQKERESIFINSWDLRECMFIIISLLISLSLFLKQFKRGCLIFNMVKIFSLRPWKECHVCHYIHVLSHSLMIWEEYINIEVFHCLIKANTHTHTTHFLSFTV